MCHPLVTLVRGWSLAYLRNAHLKKRWEGAVVYILNFVFHRFSTHFQHQYFSLPIVSLVVHCLCVSWWPIEELVMPNTSLASICHSWTADILSAPKISACILNPMGMWRLSNLSSLSGKSWFLHCQYSSHCMDVFLDSYFQQRDKIEWYDQQRLLSNAVLGNIAPGIIFLFTLPWANIRHTSFSGKQWQCSSNYEDWHILYIHTQATYHL